MSVDPLGAMCAYLLTTPVNDLTDGRVFRPKLDADTASQMPQATVVIARAGGYLLFGHGTVPIGDPRLDIFCYGSTDMEAENVAAAVVSALRALRTQVFAGTRLMWARVEGGPLPVVDPETDWPCEVLSAQVAHCEVALA